MNQPRLRDVAAHAHVSVSTVSRYVRGEISLRPETEARVRLALDELGFDADKAGSGKGNDSRAGLAAPIGVIVPHLGTATWGQAVDELTRVAVNRGMSTIIAIHLDSPERNADLLRAFAEGSVSGIISTGRGVPVEMLREITASGTPVVLFDHEAGDTVDSVVVDNRSGAFQAVSLLLAQGHRDIAIVTGLTDLPSTQDRQRGWADALTMAGVDPTGQLALSGPFTKEFGMAALAHLRLAERPPTAVFAASDVIATGLVVAARLQGLDIPADLSVVGFDGSPSNWLLAPGLTTVQVSQEAMAAAAVRLVIDRLDDPARPVEQVVTPVALVLGESVSRVSVPVSAS